MNKKTKKTTSFPVQVHKTPMSKFECFGHAVLLGLGLVILIIFPTTAPFISFIANILTQPYMYEYTKSDLLN